MQQHSELRDGRYRLTHILGSGGMATVYKAYDSDLDVVRAVKVLSPNLISRGPVRKRFTVEARTMAKLQHPHIVSVVDVGVERNQPYMVMEFLAGGSVGLRIEKLGPLTPHQGCDVIDQLLKALEEAHNNGIVHRDIKPQNLLISVDSVVKVADFGIAHIASSDHGLTQTGMVMGTLAYMSPEQRTSARQTDHRSDLYAAAASLYNILTGNEPFDLFSTDIQAKVMGDLPEPLRDFIIRGTKYAAEERFQSAVEMRSALEEARGKLPAAPETVTPLPVPPGLQGDLGDVMTDQPSVETFDSSMLPSDELGSGVHRLDSMPPTYRDISIFPSESSEAPKRSLPLIPMVVIALLITGGLGWSLMGTNSSQAPPVMAAPEPKAPSVVDTIEDEVDALMTSENLDPASLTQLDKKVETTKMKLDASLESKTQALEKAIGDDKELSDKLRSAASEAGNDLNRLGQSAFLADVSPEVRALFIRQQELQIQTNDLNTQMIILRKMAADAKAKQEAAEAAEAAEAEAEAEAEAAAQAKAARAKAAPAPPKEEPIDRKNGPKGTLVINSMPYGTVILDDEPAAARKEIQTWAGPHKVTINCHDGRTVTKTVSVKANAKTAFCWSFDEEAKCR